VTSHSSQSIEAKCPNAPFVGYSCTDHKISVGVKPLQEFLIEVTFEIPAKSMMEPASLGLQDGAMQQQEEEDIEPRKRATMHILNKMGLLQGDASDHKQTTWEQTPVRKKLDTKLKVELRDYQQQALAFMCYREEDRECPVPGFVYVLPGLWLQTATATFRSAEPSRQQSKGGILGDEMGLGKTGRSKYFTLNFQLMSLS